MTYPRRFAPGEGPPQIRALVERLLPLLLAGDHPTLLILREQLQGARVGSIELSGTGFFADIHVSAHAPKVEPPDFAGGDAKIKLEGIPVAAGCVLFVRGGHLFMLEGYIYDGNWDEDTLVQAVNDVFPIQPPRESAD
ncbi:MAG TPA: hypothetical protein VGK89_02480 [Candidatus Eisenbacteria bacterium]|jgi:hypothetical protein